MAFLRLLIWLKCDFRSIKYLSNKTDCNSFFFHPKHEFFVVGFNVDHSKLMRLCFCHDLPTLQTQNQIDLIAGHKLLTFMDIVRF